MTRTAMRLVLFAGTIFVLAAFAQLFLLTRQTDRWFAWTIKAPLSAATLGAFYGGSAVLAGLSASERSWANARAGVPGVWVFLWLTLAATLLHRDQFHLHAGGLPAAAAWAWLVLYIAQPVALTFAWIDQLRRRPRGGVPPGTAPVPAAYRALVVALAVPVLIVGTGLYLRPTTLSPHWPWPLVPLTARALAAWLLATGLLLLAVFREADWRRLRGASCGLAALGALLATAEVRFPAGLLRSRPETWLWSALAVALIGVGLTGVLADRRSRRSPVRESGVGP